MKNKRFVRHLKCFFLDHLWVILLFLAAPTFIMTVYLTVINENPGEHGGIMYYYPYLFCFAFCSTDYIQHGTFMRYFVMKIRLWKIS